LWRLIVPTEALLEQVRALFVGLDKAVFLRSRDALHLVTAKGEGFKRIYSNDPHVLAVSGSLGLEGIDPIAEQRCGA
jgi:predicted nucleic acid-binding protein